MLVLALATVVATVSAATASGQGQRARAAGGQIYWGSGRAIWRANIDGSGVHEVVEFQEARPPTYSTSVDDLAVGIDSIYWDSAGTIGRVSLSGARARKIFFGGTGAAHWLRLQNGTLYWEVDSSTGRDQIRRRATEGGGSHTILIPPYRGGTLGGFTVSGNRLYWLDTSDHWDQRSSVWEIDSAALDGSGVRQLLTLPARAPLPQDIEIGAGHVFWVAPEAHAIYRADLDGTHIKRIASSGSYMPFTLAVSGSHIYWAAQRWHGSVGESVIERADLSGRNAHVIIRRSGVSGSPGVSTALVVVP